MTDEVRAELHKLLDMVIDFNIDHGNDVDLYVEFSDEYVSIDCREIGTSEKDFFADANFMPNQDASQIKDLMADIVEYEKEIENAQRDIYEL